MGTVADLVRALAGVDRAGLLFEDQRWTHAEVVDAAARRAGWLLEHRDRERPFHVGVLLENVPEFPMWLMAAAVSGAVVVGINPTRRGAELARDITHTDCQFLVTETAYLPLVDGLDLGIEAARRIVTDERGDAYPAAALPDVEVQSDDLYLLLFTSGTTGAPKAVRCTQGRLAYIGGRVRDMFQLGPDDVCYLAMPMFHSNALMAGWAPSLAAGATSALRRRFTASGFLPDVRRFGATFFNYVGKPLTYVLATPERPDDADNPLRQVFGNEGDERDVARFGERFGCTVFDSYGSTEGGAAVSRVPGTPKGALGPAVDGICIIDAETGEECPPARFDEAGRLLNAEEAIGEIVNRLGAAGFEGYWNNDEADRARVRDGVYWTGDLGYRDADGFVYFAGRDHDWLRVDGENFAAAPVERILGRHPDVVLAAVYAVPDPDVGDRVMAAMQLRAGASFDPDGFAAFLAAQADLGTKWAPRFVRVTPELPITQTSKVLKRELRREHWECAEPVWWQADKDGRYTRMTPADTATLRAQFEARGRGHVLTV
ncbi:MAG: hypothetical protein JWO37_531 [Acidimicrobiales bacterium]|jgi:fatty-acyl-CoA synthase|nr:hypothetical protein [Acidimicrobiales bacterium]